MKIRRFLKWVFAIMMIVGIGLAAGTAGSSDLNLITLTVLLKYYTKSLVLLIGGFVGFQGIAYLQDYLDDDPDWFSSDT